MVATATCRTYYEVCRRGKSGRGGSGDSLGADRIGSGRRVVIRLSFSQPFRSNLGSFGVSLSDFDRELLQCCLDRAPRAWQNFVDRFLGLVIHVANHVADSRGIQLDQASRDDLVAEVFLVLIADDFSVLRKFRRNCSLATYLTVISRRVIVRRLNQGKQHVAVTSPPEPPLVDDKSPQRIAAAEEVHQLLSQLDEREAAIVRMYHLEGKSYDEISQATGLAVNSIGPVLTRAREKMRAKGFDR